ncbi:MAG: ABC transporter permease [Clostridiales bacterium]|nr:ABC transporter permease [Clostridiales bacterium]
MKTMKRYLSIIGVRWLLITVFLLALMFIAFASVDPLFPGSRNIANILRSVTPLLLIGVGQSVVLISGNIDLSIGSLIGMSCMVSATLLTRGAEPWAAALAAIAFCVAFGFLNGELVGRFKIPSYIATLGTMMICRGVAQIANRNYDTGYIGAGAASFRDVFFYGKTFGIYNIIWISFIIWGLAFFLLSKTRTGRHIYAIGNNLEAAGLAGVNVTFTIDKAYMVSAACAGVAGLIATAEAGFGGMNEGSTYELYAVAVAVLGGISTLGGRGLLMGTVAGSFIWVVLQNGLIRAGAPIALRNIAIGVIIIVVVLLDVSARQRRSSLR